VILIAISPRSPGINERQALTAILSCLRAEQMDQHDDTIDELSGDGTIIISQAKVGTI
jgi:hypothetical protein